MRLALRLLIAAATLAAMLTAGGASFPWGLREFPWG
jgi:hypothetical protein